jgi:tRNA U34 5-methylaminomethyl-2-thiouridine-forming methyltransferase MnmC
LKREIVVTADGSSSIYLPDWDESYHSKHGAIQEAYHVFIKNGLDCLKQDSVTILEIGFGTALNTFITYLEGKASNKNIYYVGVEAYPISSDEITSLNYTQFLGFPEDKLIFEKLHTCAWEFDCEISENFTLCKNQLLFSEIDYQNKFDLIYFDAFGFRVQPELWSAEIFKIMYNALKEGGELVTYAARSPIKKAMMEAGFTVKKFPGPPGKREMMKAYK